MSLEGNEPTGNIEGIDADSLLAGIEGSQGTDRAMTETAPVEAAPAPAAATPAVEEFSFNWNGKEIKAPREKILQWASQGYDYPQKMAEFNKKQSDFENQRKQLEQSLNPYRTIDEFAKQNPDWWTHVEQSWNERQQQAQQTQAQSVIPPEVGEKLSKFEQFMQNFEQEKQAKTREAEDKALDGEIQSIRDNYKNLDWQTPDQNGFSLEQKVLKYGAENGIKSFRTAFRDYYHDELIKLAAEQAKETQAKETQKRAKLGLLGQTQAPKKGLTPAEGVKNRSYEDLAKEGLEELGIA